MVAMTGVAHHTLILLAAEAQLDTIEGVGWSRLQGKQVVIVMASKQVRQKMLPSQRFLCLGQGVVWIEGTVSYTLKKYCVANWGVLANQ